MNNTAHLFEVTNQTLRLEKVDLFLFIAGYIMVNLNSKENIHVEIKMDSYVNLRETR